MLNSQVKLVRPVEKKVSCLQVITKKLSTCLCRVLFLKRICLSTLNGCLCRTVHKTFSTAGKMNCSPIAKRLCKMPIGQHSTLETLKRT